MNELREYHDFAVTLARECGEIARRYAAFDINAKPKSDNSPVTIADTEINSLVIKRCQDAYPTIGIMGEEESADADHESLLWVLDPIDGTFPYVFNMSASTFCLALVKNGVPMVGVIYDFMHDRLYHAIKGEGAYINDEKIVRLPYKPMKFVNFEWWHAAEIQPHGFHKMAFADKWQVVNYTSSGYMGMQVAQGRIAGQIYFGPYSWDVAALKVIAEECGCKVTDVYGNEQRYDQKINGAMTVWPEYQDELLGYLNDIITE